MGKIPQFSKGFWITLVLGIISLSAYLKYDIQQQHNRIFMTYSPFEIEIKNDINFTNSSKFSPEQARVKLNQLSIQCSEESLAMRVLLNHINTVKLLLKAGINPDLSFTPWGMSAMDVAANKNYPEIVEVLLEAGATINLIDKNGNTPLVLAVKENNLPMVKLLLSKGATPRDVDPIGSASDPIIFEALLMAGSNPYYVYPSSVTLLEMIALKNDQKRMAILENYLKPKEELGLLKSIDTTLTDAVTSFSLQEESPKLGYDGSFIFYISRLLSSTVTENDRIQFRYLPEASFGPLKSNAYLLTIH